MFIFHNGVTEAVWKPLAFSYYGIFVIHMINWGELCADGVMVAQWLGLWTDAGASRVRNRRCAITPLLTASTSFSLSIPLSSIATGSITCIQQHNLNAPNDVSILIYVSFFLFVMPFGILRDNHCKLKLGYPICTYHEDPKVYNLVLDKQHKTWHF